MSECILIADDHSIVRMGLSLLLKRYRPGAKVLDTSDFEGVLRLVDEVRFDVIVMDINMPRGNYQETVDLVKKKQPHVKILIFSALNERTYALKYLRSGSDGFLHKLSREEDVKRAISDMLEKGSHLSEGMKEAILMESVNREMPSENPGELLSEREMHIAKLLIEGFRLKDIAARLNIHVTTVSTYKIRVFEKLKISSIVELIEKFQLYDIH